jgi:hypothetical protein
VFCHSISQTRSDRFFVWNPIHHNPNNNPRSARRRRFVVVFTVSSSPPPPGPCNNIIIMVTTERSSLLPAKKEGSSGTNSVDDNSTVDLFEPVQRVAPSGQATHWFELSCTNFSPDDAPMWWKRRMLLCCGTARGRQRRQQRRRSNKNDDDDDNDDKPPDLGISTKLWRALAADLNAIYMRRINFLLFLSFMFLLISWPVCNLLFGTQRWWTIFVPMILLAWFLRHELAFTNECLIPLTLDDCYDNDDGPKPKTTTTRRSPAAATAPVLCGNNGTTNDLHPYYTAFHAVCAKYTEELASHGIKASVSSDEDGVSPQRAYLIFEPYNESGADGLYFV